MAKRDVQRLFGRRVKELRKLKRLTQEQLAEAIGRSVDTVSNIERGSSLTRISTADAIAVTLGVTLGEMFEADDRPIEVERARAKRERLRQLLDLARSLDPVALDALIDMARTVSTLRR